MQPLNVSFYGPLKKGFHQAGIFWMSNHPREKITPEELDGLLNTALMKVATIEKDVNGFRNTGICPLNPDVFTEGDVLAANLEMIMLEKLSEKMKPIWGLSPSADAMIGSALQCLSVKRDVDVTSEDNHRVSSCTLLRYRNRREQLTLE
jgi:hypothetical protein